jgi:hypothetical protein
VLLGPATFSRCPVPHSVSSPPCLPPDRPTALVSPPPSPRPQLPSKWTLRYIYQYADCVSPPVLAWCPDRGSPQRRLYTWRHAPACSPPLALIPSLFPLKSDATRNEQRLCVAGSPSFCGCPSVCGSMFGGYHAFFCKQFGFDHTTPFPCTLSLLTSAVF